MADRLPSGLMKPIWKLIGAKPPVKREEILSGQRMKEHGSYYKKLFFIKEKPVREIIAKYDEETITEHKRGRIGWFVLATNDIKDNICSLEAYRNKDDVEKCFGGLKNALNMKRMRMHSVTAMEGRIFIRFASLLIITDRLGKYRSKRISVVYHGKPII